MVVAFNIITDHHDHHGPPPSLPAHRLRVSHPMVSPQVNLNPLPHSFFYRANRAPGASLHILAHLLRPVKARAVEKGKVMVYQTSPHLFLRNLTAPSQCEAQRCVGQRWTRPRWQSRGSCHPPSLGGSESEFPWTHLKLKVCFWEKVKVTLPGDT